MAILRMKFALVNPAWTFQGSTYFGCRDPHYPLELLFAHDQIAAAATRRCSSTRKPTTSASTTSAASLERFAPDFLVIPTAPSYLFWRCPPPELRVPMEWFAALGGGANDSSDRAAQLGHAGGDAAQDRLRHCHAR